MTLDIDGVEVINGKIELLDKENERESDWAELFHTEKTNWMGWERHLIEKTTESILEQPEASEIGQIFEKLAEWKALPYKVIDSQKVLDLI